MEEKLGSACEKVERVNRKQMLLGESLLYIDIGSIDNITNRIIGHKHYTWADAPSRAQQVIKLGDVLFSTVRTYLKNIAIVTRVEYEQQICSSGFTVIRGAKGILQSKYVFYLTLFDGFLQPLNELQTGTSYPAVRDNDVFAQIVPVPPLPEQRAIVAKIEQLFSVLDNGIANLKAAKEKLEIYRQAVLKKAFEGELTKEWRVKQENLLSADELLRQIKEERQKYYESQLQEWESAVKEWEANSKKGKKLSKPKQPKAIKNWSAEEKETLQQLPEVWRWVSINETVFDSNDDIVDGPFGSNLKNSDYDENGTVPVIGISNIDEGFKTKIRYVTQDKFDTISRSAVFPGNIIVAKIGSSYGKTGIYPEWMPVGLIPANLLRIKPSSIYNRELIVHYLQSLTFKKKLDGIMKSTAQPAFNVSAFKKLPIPFFSVREQLQLKLEIETRLSLCDNILTNIEEGLIKAEALRQSILKKAFDGRLLSEAELEACRLEPDWEPAEMLLERIKKSKKEDA